MGFEPTTFPVVTGTRSRCARSSPDLSTTGFGALFGQPVGVTDTALCALTSKGRGSSEPASSSSCDTRAFLPGRWFAQYRNDQKIHFARCRRKKASKSFGGADGIRTHDLLDAIEARSQLRHGPTGLHRDVFPFIAPQPESVKRPLTRHAL